MANPGYGKRTAPGEPGVASRPADFTHLPVREAYIAAYVDRLPEGAAMDVKSLAKTLPLYGQQAVRSALNFLSRAGHLHRVRGLATTSDSGTRWVFRTFWSSTARDSAWWARFLDGDEAVHIAGPVGDSDEVTPSSDPAPEPAPTTPESHRATAYRTLARLGRIDSRLALSDADCSALTDLVVPWLERGATPVSLLQAVTSGLPDAVHAPRGFVARRLRDKLPPSPTPSTAPEPAPEAGEPRPLRRLMPECTECGVPGRPAAFVGGLCRGCRSTAPAESGAPSATTLCSTRQDTAALVRQAALTARDRRQSAKSRPVAALRP
ncbi:MarR family transcriptional regulator [Streptomyces spinoverrucosus]|uniref:MarR family transcriptional regulator n=1 Tax=Streptomyces spinoverrucosus TaxID=284043 RepID=UPI0018C3EF2C|nr:MarR family transcriptional regulator [Streptomyces spinoverrucosus]MBG0853070.1 MarR family transcriptional regulator [Streptomyces spinoverrucosus]